MMSMILKCIMKTMKRKKSLVISNQHQEFATNSIKYENEDNILLDVVDKYLVAVTDRNESQSEQSLDSSR